MSRKFRIFVFSSLMALAGTLLLINVLSLNLNGKTLMSDVDFQQESGVTTTTETLVATRGNITDSEGNLIASDVTVYKIQLILSKTSVTYSTDENGDTVENPNYVTDPAYYAEVLAEILGGDYDYIYAQLTRDAYQVEIGTCGSNISYDTKAEIEELGLAGVKFVESTSRYYSYSSMASHLIGYVNTNLLDDGTTVLTGIAGIEKALNSELSGTNGTSVYYSDVSGNILSGGQISKEDSTDGYDVELTLNKRIQQGVDTMLEDIMELSDVDKAWCIVMDAKTGAILGYDSYPTYDANTLDITDYNDYCATLPYEPGSTLKSFTYAIAIEQGNFDASDTFNSNNYYLATGDDGTPVRVTKSESSLVIHNVNNYQWGDVTYEQGYINSLNVATVTLLEEQIGKETYIEYMEEFGFYQAVDVLGIDEGTDYGTVNYDDAFSLACATFGSGNTVTALQLMQGYTAFCNGGEMIKPYIIQSITDSDTGEVIYEGGREVVSTPIKEETADEVLRLMEQVVSSGLHRSASTLAIDNCSIGCKTGTAPVASSTGYDSDLVIHSVMITMPADDPEVLIYVAYQDDQDSQRNFSYIRELEILVANTLGISDEEAEEEEVVRTLVDLPFVVNHTITYVKNKDELEDLEVIILSDGDTVVSQYPAAGNTVLSGSRLILLTDGENIYMPDMTGWSRNEVTAFWEMTGIEIQIQGDGYVVSQSIEADTLLDSTMIIEVQLE